jgi:hypothetical protein
MISLWDKNSEKTFFIESLKNFASPEQLFYVTQKNRYLAYWPKGYKGPKGTIQSRNSLIGNFTEKWVTSLFNNIARERSLYAIQGAICDEIGLTARSPGDVVISRKNGIQQMTDDILLIIEVKMSLVWNWELTKEGNVVCIGDYTTHQGTPGLLRSDSMLKATGKSINIRVSNYEASRIPIIVIGNTPITNSYYNKVDHLKTSGIIQGFWSINPSPRDGNMVSLKKTEKDGFIRFDTFSHIRKATIELLDEQGRFFSSMKSNKELGKIIELSNKGKTYEEKGELFLKLIRGE